MFSSCNPHTWSTEQPGGSFSLGGVFAQVTSAMDIVGIEAASLSAPMFLTPGTLQEQRYLEL